MSRRTVVLNFDDAAGHFPDAQAVDLRRFQEAIRFGCGWRQFRDFARWLSPQLPAQTGAVFTGSGDYHHLSWLLLSRLPANRPVQLIVCDNHPDNMRYPFGIHCGSWVYWASRLPQVAAVHVIGISSADIGAGHAWENHWRPLMSGKLTYWSVGRPARWTRLTGRPDAARNFDHADALLDAFLPQVGALPVYLSVDKDVLSPAVVSTNWDQGTFREQDLLRLIARCRGRLAGADITGDVSQWRYRSRFKRLLSGADGQRVPEEEELRRWQTPQQALNRRLLAALSGAWIADKAAD
ncbi:hypothetical protein B5M10_14330 [Pluralibacter gergoviae]|uniref:hypothetical protein n=1 Tax=Pluralibacter gergoviae TaxID=61647 RepID=UPI0005EC4213|nr:hypothetical protein [Pluralibacter gergoviae]KJM64856.1 hypothetical protein SS31_07430 [Pluralibacter gergoviae]OUQ99960.1 hypothetical protein B5M10_14330 [Pluralibacter gergoviae]